MAADLSTLRRDRAAGYCVPPSASPDDRGAIIARRAREALVDPYVRRVAAGIACANCTPRERAAAVLRRAQAAGFVPDPPGCDAYRPVAVTLREGGDCDDLTPVVMALGTLCGFRAYCAYLRQDDAPQDHVTGVLVVDGSPEWAEPSIRGARLGEHPYEAARRLGYFAPIRGTGSVEGVADGVVANLLTIALLGAAAYFGGRWVAGLAAVARDNPRRPRAMPETGEQFVRTLLATPAHPTWKGQRAWRRGAVTVDGARVPLVLKRDPSLPHRVLWYLGDAKEPLAAGTAAIDRDRPDVLLLGSSGVAPDARRRGVYQGVLREMRRLNGAPIESDRSLTAGAIGAWERAGGVPDERQGDAVMRINPDETPDERRERARRAYKRAEDLQNLHWREAGFPDRASHDRAIEEAQAEWREALKTPRRNPVTQSRQRNLGRGTWETRYESEDANGQRWRGVLWEREDDTWALSAHAEGKPLVVFEWGKASGGMWVDEPQRIEWSGDGPAPLSPQQLRNIGMAGYTRLEEMRAALAESAR